MGPFINCLRVLVWVYNNPGITKGAKNTLGVKLAYTRMGRDL